MAGGPDRKPIRVLCVDDHPLFREGIAAVIEGQSDIELAGSASDGRSAVEVFKHLRPDVTLMDLRMPELDGIQAINLIKGQFPQARFIVLTTYPGDVHALGALKAGASGYLLKSTVGTDLLVAIRTVHAGKRFIPPDVAAELGLHAADETLSSREVEVLRRVAGGESNKRIARELNIAESTVKAHIRNILPKLHASDRTHAVTIALKRGIFDL